MKTLTDKKRLSIILVAHDENPSTIVGCALLLTTLKEHAPRLMNNARVFVITPSFLKNSTLSRLLEPHGAVCVSVPSESQYDNYYMIKVILRTFISHQLARDETFLYLDYDHICFSETTLPILPQGHIMLGTNRQSFVREKAILKKTHEDRHLKKGSLALYNSSLVYAGSGDFLKASSAWEKTFRSIRGTISERYIEEISLIISLIDRGAVISPVPEGVQGSWEATSSAALFHYGGERKGAKLLKMCLAGKIKPEDLPCAEFGENRRVVLDCFLSAYKKCVSVK